MADAKIGTITCDTSDGDWPGLADFSFSSFDSSKTLLPDAYFFQKRGYEDLRRQVAQNPVDWSARSEDIVWRGTLTGVGLPSINAQMQAHPGVMQRLRMGSKCNGRDIDFKLVLGRRDEKLNVVLNQAGLVGERIPPFSWNSRKFAIDIDGYSNAWDNLFHRLLMGCCVLKVGSNFGFKQWYYKDLVPYQHYVPIRSDLGDLDEKIDWVRSHDHEAKEIAAAGQALAQSLTWDSERHRAGRIITKRIWGCPR